MFEFITENVPTKFVVLNGKEVEARAVLGVLEAFADDDDINNYDLNIVVADVLVSEGILEIHSGSRNATLYRKTRKFETFYGSFMKET